MRKPGWSWRLSIENTRWVSFDIKFTRQGFENACWHREACRAIQHAFSKPSLVNLISKDVNLVFYLSVYLLLNTLQTSNYDVIFYFCVDSCHSISATSSWPDKGNMLWDRKRLLGYVETIQLILVVPDKTFFMLNSTEHHETSTAYLWKMKTFLAFLNSQRLHNVKMPRHDKFHA